MSCSGVVAESRPRDNSRVPDALKPAVLTLERLKNAGVLQNIEGWLEVARPRGHRWLALFVVVLIVVLAGPTQGIRPLLQGLDRTLRRRLGVLAMQRSLPTAASLSRALSRLDRASVERFVRSLLAASVDKSLLDKPAVQHHDATGASWHVLDIDPTVKAFRRRDLPESDALAAPTRRAGGEPGYVGRKRGEARVRFIPVGHAGSGLWLGMRWLEQEGSVVPACREAVGDAIAALGGVGIEPRQVIVRGDGEFGSVGAIRAISASGASPLVRLSRYKLLEREEVKAHLAEVSWMAVPHGESNIPRVAAELGTFHLHGSRRAEDKGEVTVRVVVVRTPRSSEDGHGVVIDGYQHELFATTLDARAWPAGDLVALYHERSTIENRFAQEDRELGLNRTFSFHGPGQAWVYGIGLFLWNEQIVAGVQLSPLLIPTVEQTPRVPGAEVTTAASDIATPDEEELPSSSSEPDITTSPAASADDAAPAEPSDEQDALPDEVVALLHKHFADVEDWPGWTVNADGTLTCANGKRLHFFSASPRSKRERARVAVRTESWACDGCPLRAKCYDGRGAYKQVARHLSDDEFELAAAALAARKTRRPPRRKRRTERAPQTDRAPGSQPTPKPSEPAFTPPSLCEEGPWHFQPPLFLPAAARSLIRERGDRVDVYLKRRRRPARGTTDTSHPLLASDQASRAHRRSQKTAIDQALSDSSEPRVQTVQRAPGIPKVAQGSA